MKGYSVAKATHAFLVEEVFAASEPGLDEYPLLDPTFYFATRTRPELFLKSSEFRVLSNRLFPSRLLQIF